MLRHLFALNAEELEPKKLGRVVSARLGDMGYLPVTKESGINAVYMKKDPHKEFRERAVVFRGGEYERLIPSDYVHFYQERPTFSGGEYAYLGRFDLVRKETVAGFLAKPHPHPIRSGINQLTLGIFEKICP